MVYAREKKSSSRVVAGRPVVGQLSRDGAVRGEGGHIFGRVTVVVDPVLVVGKVLLADAVGGVTSETDVVPVNIACEFVFVRVGGRNSLLLCPCRCSKGTITPSLAELQRITVQHYHSSSDIALTRTTTATPHSTTAAGAAIAAARTSNSLGFEENEACILSSFTRRERCSRPRCRSCPSPSTTRCRCRSWFRQR